MAILCLVYFAVVGAAFGVVALLVDRALAPRSERRVLWMATMVLSAFLPILSSFQHRSTSLEIWGMELVRLSGAPAGILASANPGWFVCDTPLGANVMRVWGVSILILAVLFILDFGRLSWRLRATRRTNDPTMIDGVAVVVTDALGPATVGFWRAQIVIPHWVLAMSERHRQYVVRHEEEHRRTHDTRLLVIAAAIVCLMPWNVALWWQLRRLRMAVEMDCDRRVVATLGDALSYGKLLLDVAQASRNSHLQPALLGRAGTLERRLIALVSTAPRRMSERVVALAVALLVAWLVISVPHPVPRLAPPAAAAHSH